MMDITLKGTIDYEAIQPYKIELTRGQKGTYAWTITVHAATPKQAIHELAHLDQDLQAKYLPHSPPAEETS